MLQALSDAPVLGTMTVEVPGNGSRKARIASIEMRVAEVTIQAPPRRGAHAKASASSEPATVTLIGATEPSPPAGSESISWVLLTNLTVKDFESATEKVRWYGKRWGIEIWHKVLKSGCKVDRMLEEAERLKRYLTVFSIIGVRLMQVAYLARAHPDPSATEVFSAVEIQVLHLRVTKALPPAAQSITLREIVRMLGKLGGHLGRKGDGEPGVLIL
jgi:hypothetical protein